MKISTSKTALITGIRGQDGYYLTRYLLEKGYRVVGTSHVVASTFPVPAGYPKVDIERLDLRNIAEVEKIIAKVRPDEIYNLAARSSSAQLFDDPIATAEINGVATVRFLECIRKISPHTRFCQAASSEIFANVNESPQDENTQYCPINAYGAAKTYAANMVKAYREHHGLFATVAILFNHESPRRKIHYVTRKITHTVAKIILGKAKDLELGNIDNQRDWGFAGDYIRAMWLMLQQSTPEDYVIATGVTHTIRNLCEIAFSYVGLDYHNFVQINPQWDRRLEKVKLCGNAEKIKQNLNWKPTIEFADLVHMMVDSDLNQLKNNLNCS